MHTTILGCGAWACALAGLLAKNGHTVCMWGRNPEKVQQLRCRGCHPNCEVPLPESLEITNDLDRALTGSELVIESVTVSGLREVFTALRRREIALPLILTSKGLENQSLKFPSQIADEILGLEYEVPVCLLSGPTLAREVVGDKPTAAVLACRDLDIAKNTAGIFKSPKFNVVLHRDMLGVQFGGAYKNIVGIACGILEEKGLGVNAKAAFISRSLHEMRKIALHLGCMPQTLLGLSGIGDIIATCFSHSENQVEGQISKKTLNTRQKVNQNLAENRESCENMIKLTNAYDCEIHILKTIEQVLSGNASQEHLMKITPNEEIVTEWR